MAQMVTPKRLSEIAEDAWEMSKAAADHIATAYWAALAIQAQTTRNVLFCGTDLVVPYPPEPPTPTIPTNEHAGLWWRVWDANSEKPGAVVRRGLGVILNPDPSGEFLALSPEGHGIRWQHAEIIDPQPESNECDPE